MRKRKEIEIWKIKLPGVFFPRGVIGGHFWSGTTIHFGNNEIMSWPNKYKKLPSFAWKMLESNNGEVSATKLSDDYIPPYEVIWKGEIDERVWEILYKTYLQNRIVRDEI